MDVSIVARSGPIWSGESASVVFPSADGEMGVLAGHSPTLALLKPGTVRVKDENDQEQAFEVNSGFVTVDNDKVYIVTEL